MEVGKSKAKKYEIKPENIVDLLLLMYVILFLYFINFISHFKIFEIFFYILLSVPLLEFTFSSTFLLPLSYIRRGSLTIVLPFIRLGKYIFKLQRYFKFIQFAKREPEE